mgnify:CR=1 FL=1
MKHNRILRIMVSLMVLLPLMLTLTATPALAQSISIDPDRGEVDDEIDVEGDGFDPGDYVYVFFSNEEADEGDDIEDLDSYEYVGSDRTGYAGASDEGELSMSFDVPDRLTDGDKDINVSFGIYYIYVSYDSDGDDIVDYAEFSITGIEASSTQGNVGDEIDITGAGFGSRDDIEIRYDGDEIDIESGDTETDRDGEFECSIVIPASTAGDHDIEVEANGDEVDFEFTVVPAITFTPVSGNVGDEVTVSGTGFGRSNNLTVYFGNDPVTMMGGAAKSDSDGRFDDLEFAVPPQGAGSYDIRVRDSGNNSATARTKFTISGTVDVSPTGGDVGTMITASGTGFIPNSAVTIKYDDDQVTTTKARPDGAFTVDFAAPESEGGVHTITVSGTITKQFTFTMESTPPPVPELHEPAASSEVKAQASFDWEDVTDPSLPVTYMFQIGSNQTFSSIVLEKKGLPVSEYVLIREERLDSVTKDNPYYWRVKAIDGASNESDWSTPRSFYVLAPPVPELMLPEADTKAKGQVSFDWEDVTSLSPPVTYSLQVSPDEDFTWLVLQKKGLSDSEYTLTEDEELPAVKKEAPYYWRIKASDAAGNESDWSTPRSFHVGFVFELTGWVLYTLMALGGLILLLIGFLLGRRIAYS